MVDVALLVVWLLFMAVLIAMPFTPDERYATWPFWLLAFQYWTFGIPFFTGFLFILTDVRVLRRAAPSFAFCRELVCESWASRWLSWA